MGSVASLAFSPDGNLLAVCGSSFDDMDDHDRDGVRELTISTTGPGRLKVWEVKTGTLKHDLVGHDEHANAVAFSPDGKWLASAGDWLNESGSGTGVIIWNPHTGTKIRTFATKANGGTWSVAFSPNSKLVVISSRTFDKDSDTSTSSINLLHAGTGIMEWRQTVPGWGQPAIFSPDGKSVAVLCGGDSIRFFETETGTMMREMRSADSPHGGRWSDFAIAPQGHRLAIGGVDKERKGSVELWDFDGLPE
jgi:WD40 repeat protein